MDDKVYIRFNEPKGKSSPSPGRLERAIENVVVKILSTVIPKANPDFEDLLDKVAYWKIEYNKRENVTWREIGFDQDGNFLVAMPCRDNYGYWTDNHLTLEDYTHFDPTSISVAEFENDWIAFEKKNEK